MTAALIALPTAAPSPGPFVVRLPAMPDPDSVSAIVGRNVRRGRDARGWTQRELAAALEVGEKDVSRWENGHVEPSGAMRLQIAALLFDGDLAALYGGRS